MKLIAIMIAGLLVWPLLSHSANDEYWLGLEETRYSLHINYGFDSEQESISGVALQTPALAYSELLFSYFSYDVSTEDGQQVLENYGIAWTSDPYAAWALELAYSFQGKSDAVEVTENKLGVYHSLENWQMGAQLFLGEVRGYRRENIVERFNIPDSASIDREGYGFSLSRIGAGWTWQLDFNDFNYSRDLSNVLHSRLFLLNFNDAVISQVLLLTNWSASLQVQKELGVFALNAGVERYEEVVERREDTMFSAGLLYALSQDVDFAIDYFYFSEDTQDLVNFTLTLNW